MNAEDRNGYTAAVVLAAGGTLVGYYIPIVGVVLTVCLLLVVVAALMGDEGGAMTDLIARPFTALGRWLAQKDESRWLRRAPFIGLVAGWILRWVTNGLTASGGT